MPARIYRPSRNAMQSGKAKTHTWYLEFEQETPRAPEPLMGWTSTSDTKTQVVLKFLTQEDAEAYARKHGIAYTLQVPPPVRMNKKSYSDNFKFGRTENWTH